MKGPFYAVTPVASEHVTTLAVLGDHDSTKPTHRELEAALGLLPADVRALWVGTDSDDAADLSGFDGLWVVPGSPYADDAAVYAAIQWARVSGRPFLGTCSGFQYAVVEFARNVAGLRDAAHAEESPDAEKPVVEALSCSLVDQRREVSVVAGTKLAGSCGTEPFVGSHWCNFGVADAYVDALGAAGLTVAATAEDAGVEAVEYGAHPFFVATLFQPQMGASRTGELHPLIAAFVNAARELAQSRTA